LDLLNTSDTKLWTKYRPIHDLTKFDFSRFFAYIAIFPKNSVFSCRMRSGLKWKKWQILRWVFALDMKLQEKFKPKLIKAITCKWTPPYNLWFSTSKILMFRSNAAKEDMNRLQKYFRIILLVWVDNFCLLPQMIWEKSWKSFHPTVHIVSGMT